MNFPTWAISPAVAVSQNHNQKLVKVTALAHAATFLGDTPSEPNYHLKVTNVSPNQEVEIDYIWFELADDQQLHMLGGAARTLPARLRRQETFETWLPVALVSGIPDWDTRFRVKLSSGGVFVSRLNKSVPAVGMVAGGGESPNVARLSPESPGVTGVNPEGFDVWSFGGSTSASAIHEPFPKKEIEP